MALGNNLKRIKKDSLIPDTKKGTTAKPKAPQASKSKPKKLEVLSTPTEEKKAVVDTPKAKEVVKPKPTKKEIPQPAPEKKKESAPSLIKPSTNANLEEKILLGGDENSPITAKLIPSRRKAVRKTKLILEGSLSLLQAEAIKDCLLSTFNDYDLIDIELANITNLDIIAVQMIRAFIEYYPDKKVKIDSDLPFDIKIIVERAGFGPLMFKEEVA